MICTTKFQIGDILGVIDPFGCSEARLSDIVEVVKEEQSDSLLETKRRSDGVEISMFSRRFKLINEKSMEQVNEIAVDILSADDKALVEAGYLTKDLSLTLKTRDILAALSFKQFKKELVAKAKEDIKNEAKK